MSRENKSGFMQFKDLEINEYFLQEPWEPDDDVWAKCSATEATINHLVSPRSHKVRALEIVQRVRVVERAEPY